MKKILFIVLDGAAGRPCKTLGGKSSLEAANTPIIDSLFKDSINGLMNVIGPNIAPQSDVAAFALLGYNPFKVPARGVIEAIGAGIKYHEGEVALRCNLANVKQGKLVKIRLSELTKDKGLQIEKLINEGISLDVPFTFKHTEGYRCVLVLHKNLSDQVTNTHPGYIRQRLGVELISVAKKINEGITIKECKALAPEAQVTANIINDFTKQASQVLTKAGLGDLRSVETNYIFTRDAGNSLPELDSFEDKHDVNMALIAEMPVELGVAQLLEMDVIKPINDAGLMVNKIIKSLEKYDGIYIHLKGPDIYGHLGDATGKVREIERIDKEFMSQLIKSIDLKNNIICITSDHATPACFGSHSNDPVPYLITGDGNGQGHFCEKTVNKKFIEGKELMNKVINQAR
ncbi:MAG: alkaline phosphatase family protein [Candidatus Nanoarchaeia archaeon]|jgi:2,3-bisphosphoglycerate-independent phosphoglycerate mutase